MTYSKENEKFVAVAVALHLKVDKAEYLVKNVDYEKTQVLGFI